MPRRWLSAGVAFLVLDMAATLTPVGAWTEGPSPGRCPRRPSSRWRVPSIPPTPWAEPRGHDAARSTWVAQSPACRGRGLGEGIVPAMGMSC